MLAQPLDDPPLEAGLAARALRVDEDRGDPGGAGALEGEGVGDVADHGPHLGVEPAGRHGVEDRLEVRAAARGEHAEGEPRGAHADLPARADAHRPR